MYTQNTGDYNDYAKHSLNILKDTIHDFNDLCKKCKVIVSMKDIKEDKRLVKVAMSLLEKTRIDNLWDIESLCMIIRNVWNHCYHLREALNAFCFM
jgi:hypothetical protein